MTMIVLELLGDEVRWGTRKDEPYPVSNAKHAC
jgi:hypothetical protein